jgi:hypothetical protein
MLMITSLACLSLPDRDVERVDVAVTGAYIGPGLAPLPGEDTTKSWDGFDIPAEVFTALAMLAAEGVPLPSQVGEVLAQFNDYLSAPDPTGWGELNVGEGYGWAKEFDPEDRNAFSIDFEDLETWENVPLTDDTRLRIHMADRDWIEDDSIGIAVLNKVDLMEARDEAQIHSIWVGDQTEYQLLFVRVEVW